MNSIWFPKFPPDSGLKWSYWFFWLLHNVLMSWLRLLHPPPSPIHPFSSWITHEVESLNITLYSHLMMNVHDKEGTEGSNKHIKKVDWVCFQLQTDFLISFCFFVVLAPKKGEKVSECLYRINGCAHNRTTNPIKTIKNRFYRESLLPTASINWYSYKVPRTNDLVKTIRLNWSCLDETTRLEMWCILGWV